MLGKVTNPLLAKIEQAIQASVPAAQKQAFERIVLAGIKVMYSDETRDMLKNQMSQPGDPADTTGQGVAKLIALLYKESKQTMPMDAAIFAAQFLLCEALDFMEKAGKLQVTVEVNDAATQAMIAYLLQLFGMSQDKIRDMMEAGMQANPDQVANTGKPAPEQPAEQPAAPAQAPAAEPAAGIVGSAMKGQ